MATHKIQVVLDEATGRVTVRHFASAPFTVVETIDEDLQEVERQAVIHEDVVLDEAAAASLKATLTAILDANRKKADRAATRAAALHETIEARKRK